MPISIMDNGRPIRCLPHLPSNRHSPRRGNEQHGREAAPTRDRNEDQPPFSINAVGIENGARTDGFDGLRRLIRHIPIDGERSRLTVPAIPRRRCGASRVFRGASANSS